MAPSSQTSAPPAAAISRSADPSSPKGTESRRSHTNSPKHLTDRMATSDNQDQPRESAGCDRSRRPIEASRRSPPLAAGGSVNKPRGLSLSRSTGHHAGSPADFPDGRPSAATSRLRDAPAASGSSRRSRRGPRARDLDRTWRLGRGPRRCSVTKRATKWMLWPRSTRPLSDRTDHAGVAGDDVDGQLDQAAPVGALLNALVGSAVDVAAFTEAVARSNDRMSRKARAPGPGGLALPRRTL